jgi:hypothetical protein
MHMEVRSMYFGAKVGLLIALISSVAMAEDISCGCGAGGVVFADDPLVEVEYGYTAFVYPGMVTLNEGGECYVENFEAYMSGEPMATFVDGDVEYGQIIIFSSDDVVSPGGQFATLEEVEIWAESICFPPTA